MTTTLEKVRAKIIEAVPEIEWYRKDGRSLTSVIGLKYKRSRPRPITLADVLRAMSAHATPMSVNSVGAFEEWSREGMENGWMLKEYGPIWNLSLPLDEQEPEVWEFLHKILCV